MMVILFNHHHQMSERIKNRSGLKFLTFKMKLQIDIAIKRN